MYTNGVPGIRKILTIKTHTTKATWPINKQIAPVLDLYASAPRAGARRGRDSDQMQAPKTDAYVCL